MHHLTALFLFQGVQGATWGMSVLLGWMKQVLFPLGLEIFNDKGSKAIPKSKSEPYFSKVFAFPLSVSNPFSNPTSGQHWRQLRVTFPTAKCHLQGMNCVQCHEGFWPRDKKKVVEETVRMENDSFDCWPFNRKTS